MAGPLDVLTAIQNGVVALNDLGKQVSGSFTSIKSQLVATVTSIAGNSGAFTLNSVSGITNSTNDILLSQASSSQFGAVKVNATTIAASGGVISLNMSPITASTSADITTNNATYVDGPSVAQGSSGTWFASGNVTLSTTAGAQTFNARLWDGTTIIDSGSTVNSAATFTGIISLSGYLASPTGNIRISATQIGGANVGKILFNITGNSKDSTITAIRIG